MNTVTLAGRLGQKPEAKAVGDTFVTNVSLATTDYYGKADPKHTNWHNLVIWGPNATFLSRYLDKGAFLVVTGEIRYRQYVKDGVTKYITEIKVKDLDAPKTGVVVEQTEPEKTPPSVVESTPIDDSVPF